MFSSFSFIDLERKYLRVLNEELDYYPAGWQVVACGPSDFMADFVGCES